MKIMIDSNVFISAAYNPNSIPAKTIHVISQHHELILCDYIINECYDTVNRKFPQHIPELDKLMEAIVCKKVAAPRAGDGLIADPKDAPILNAAVLYDVDVIVSGDKHFLQLSIKRPKVMKAADFLENYGADE